MRVLLVVSSYLPILGGLQNVTAQLASALQRQGNIVQVLTQKYPRALLQSEIIDRVRVRRLHFLIPRLNDLRRGRFDLFIAGLYFFPLTLAYLLWRIVRDKPDTVNLHFVGAPGFFLLVARKLLNFRYVVSLHGDDVEGLSRGTSFDRWVFHATLRQADFVTACSRYLLERALVIEPSIALKARVVYNGLDLCPEPKSGSFVGREGKRGAMLLAVGRLVSKKGFDVLLRALCICRKTDINVYLTLIGDGPERHTLEALKGELGLDGNVILCGALNRDMVAREIASSDIIVIPSRQEPFGLVALEAMSCGKPIIASRVGGLPEVLESADAMLVAPDQPEELARAITQMWAMLEREPGYGTGNRDNAARFSSDRMVDGYCAIYQGNRVKG